MNRYFKVIETRDGAECRIGVCSAPSEAIALAGYQGRPVRLEEISQTEFEDYCDSARIY